MVPTLAVIVLIVVVGVSVLAFRNRSAKGIESGISSFRRELRALAPESDEPPRPARPPVDPPRTSGVGVLRPDPDAGSGERDVPGASTGSGHSNATDSTDGTDSTDATDGEADGRTD